MKGIWPIEIWLMRCWRGYRLEQSANRLHIVQLMPLPPYHVCFSKTWMVYRLTWVVSDKGHKTVVVVILLLLSGFVYSPSFSESQQVGSSRSSKENLWRWLEQIFTGWSGCPSCRPTNSTFKALNGTGTIQRKLTSCPDPFFVHHNTVIYCTNVCNMHSTQPKLALKPTENVVNLWFLPLVLA